MNFKINEGANRMDFIFEFIFELLFEGMMIASTDKKISKAIRYPLIILVSFIFVMVCGGLLFLGFHYLYIHPWTGIFFMMLGLFISIGTLIKFKRMYNRK